MSRRLLLPILFAMACTDGTDKKDTDASSTDETVDTDESAETDTTSSDDETDDDTTDTDGASDTDETAAGLASSWTGTWSFTWRYEDRDYTYPGPGELWNSVDSSCTSGTMTVTLSETGEMNVPAPFGACSQGVQRNWTHAILDTDITTDGTHAITGRAVFGTVTGPTFSGGMAVDVTGTVGADGDNALGLMTISGSRVQNQEHPTENLSFTATLRPTPR